jgi:hypothetical protein
MSNFALSTVVIMLFIFAAGLGLGSLARAQFERRLKRDAENAHRGAPARASGAPTVSAAHVAASVSEQTPKTPVASRKASSAAGKKTAPRKTAVAAPIGSKPSRPRKPGNKV